MQSCYPCRTGFSLDAPLVADSISLNFFIILVNSFIILGFIIPSGSTYPRSEFCGELVYERSSKNGVNEISDE